MVHSNIKIGIILTKEEISMGNIGAGRRIQHLREANGYTREAFAEKAQISSKFLYEIELGKKGFSAEILLNISRVLSVSCDYIMTGNNKTDEENEQISEILESIDPGQMRRVKEILRLIQEISAD